MRSNNKAELPVRTAMPEHAGTEMKSVKKTGIPVFLCYPEDLLSRMMFGSDMEQVHNDKCGYRFMLNTDVAETEPVIEARRSPLEIDETHYYFKAGELPWYVVSTMKDVSVAGQSVRGWVERADQFAVILGAMDMVLRTPTQLRGKAYKRLNMVDMREWPEYNKRHGFEESRVYGHVFELGEQTYKKFILVAKRRDWSWRVEVNIPTGIARIIPSDFVPAGQTFGSFYPEN